MAVDKITPIKEFEIDGIKIPLVGSENLDTVLNTQDSLLADLENNINNLPEAGDSESIVTTGKYSVKVIDYDGNVLKEQWLNTGDKFILPNAPTYHERLEFDMWVGNVDIVNNEITVENFDIAIGPIYKTKSGYNEFDIEMTKITGLNAIIYFEGEKDWGDGAVDSETTHTYSDYGKYTVVCKSNTMTNNFICGQNAMGTNNYSKVLIEARLNKVDNFNPRMFQGCANLKRVNLSSQLTFDGNLQYSFAQAYSINTVILPSNIQILTSTFYNAYSLENIIFNNNLASIIDRGSAPPFANCLKLKTICLPKTIEAIPVRLLQSSGGERLFIPDTITTLGISMFYQNNMIEEVHILGDITTCEDYVFNNARCLRKIVFYNLTALPVLPSSNVLNVNSIDFKIFIPDVLYEESLTATNWTNKADYIYKLSDLDKFN